LAFLLVACGSQATPTVSMSEEKEMVSETMGDMEDTMNNDEAMMEDDNMMDEMDDEAMSEVDDMASNSAGSDQDSDEMMGHDDAAATGDKEDDMMDDKEDDAMSDDEMADESMMMLPDWFKASLNDVNSDTSFSLTDFKGKVILVETMAIWCSNCLKQQGQVLALHDLVGERDDFVSVGLDIDPNENAEALKVFTGNHGFDWVYAVAPTEVAREIGQLYGDQFLNPPSTPMLIIDREGEAHPLPFGIKSADDLLDALQPFLNAEM
jgi:thiol-disulfide isomerase/thioredoxin